MSEEKPRRNYVLKAEPARFGLEGKPIGVTAPGPPPGVSTSLPGVFAAPAPDSEDEPE